MKSNNFDILEALWLRREKKRRAQKTIEGAPPLTYTAKNAGALKNYRIYGQTVDGESVGDLVTSGEHAGEYKVPVTVEGKNLWSGVVEQGAVSITGDYGDNSKRIRSKNIPLEPGTYKLTSNLLVRMIFAYHDSTKFGKIFDGADGSENPSFTVPESANNISVAMMKLVDGAQVDITPEDFEYGQIEKGSEATPYEPYQPPVTTPIYLPEQIKKVGDEAEYIDYAEQKQHFVGGTSVDVTLPALPTIAGTNTLSVGTQVQPSSVKIEGKIKGVS